MDDEFADIPTPLVNALPVSERKALMEDTLASGQVSIAEARLMLEQRLMRETETREEHGAAWARWREKRAGSPTPIGHKQEPAATTALGKQYAQMALNDLSKISKNDPERNDAVEHVMREAASMISPSFRKATSALILRRRRSET